MMQHSNTPNSQNVPPANIPNIVSMLGERYVLDILDAVSAAPKSAKEIAHDAEVPTTTLYRRLDGLVDTGLLEESIRLDGGGDHYHVYRATLEHLKLSRSEAGLDLDVSIDIAEASDRWDDAMTTMREQA